MSFRGSWRRWRSVLLEPVADALLQRSPPCSHLDRHALGFPGAFAEAAAAEIVAAGSGFRTDADWQRRRLLVAALDRQDNMARLLHRAIAAPDRLEVRGCWPGGRFIALGMHWGAGFPALEHLLRAGHKPAFVYRPENPSELESWPDRCYDRLHLRALKGFGNSICVGGAYRRIIDALEAGCVPVVLFDAPPTTGSSSLMVVNGAYRLRLRAALFRLIVDQAVNCVFFRCGYQTGCPGRLLEIGSPVRSDDPKALAEAAADFMLKTLREDSAQWHLWPMADALLASAQSAGHENSLPSPCEVIDPS